MKDTKRLTYKGSSVKQPNMCIYVSVQEDSYWFLILEDWTNSI